MGSCDAQGQPPCRKRSNPKRRICWVFLNLFPAGISAERRGNEFAGWFGEDFDKLDIVTTFNLVYNAAIMVEAGVAMPSRSTRSPIRPKAAVSVFRPLWPQLDSGLNVIWKKKSGVFRSGRIILRKTARAFWLGAREKAIRSASDCLFRHV